MKAFNKFSILSFVLILSSAAAFADAAKTGESKGDLPCVAEGGKGAAPNKGGDVQVDGPGSSSAGSADVKSAPPAKK